MDETLAAVECEDCPLDSDEFLDLLDIDPLYMEAQEYLYDQEIGLGVWREEPRPKLKAAIRFVHSESHRQREKKREDLQREKELANRKLGNI